MKIKNKNLIKIIAIFCFLFLILVLTRNTITGTLFYKNENSEEKTKIGYCPTMYEEAKKIAEEKNYELVYFESAALVLNALNRKNIDLALIGRKAKKEEIKIPTITGAAIIEDKEKNEEKTSNQGYTLISKEKKMIDYSSLHLIEIHTYISKETAEKLFPKKTKIVYHTEKEEAIKQIKNGKNVLIDWSDWQDEFELLIVMKGSEKAKEFRGIFLYEN
jgi:hypothetical protein